jgi:hypothetical protein
MDRSADAQLLAAAALALITVLLMLIGRKREVAKKETTWTDAAGTTHTLKQGWIVPPGASPPADAVELKRLSVFRSLYLGKDNRASTSKAVALAWTYAVVYGLLSLLAARFLGFDAPWNKQVRNGLQEEYLLLLGGPLAAAVVAKYTAVATEGATKKTTAPSSRKSKDAKNLIADDEGDTDLGDFQYVLFNLVALAFFLGDFIPHLSKGFPHLPALLTGLALTSASGYTAKKAVTSVTGPQLTSVFPGKAAQGKAIEVWGRNLVAAGEKPRVSIGDVVAPTVDVIATSSAADQLKVTIPTTVATGEQAVKVTTAAGAQALTAGGVDHLAITVT